MPKFKQKIEGLATGEFSIEDLTAELFTELYSGVSRESLLADLDAALSRGIIQNEDYQSLVDQLVTPDADAEKTRIREPGRTSTNSLAGQTPDESEQVSKSKTAPSTNPIGIDDTTQISPSRTPSISSTDSSQGSSFVPGDSDWARSLTSKGKESTKIEPGTIIKDRFVIESMLGRGGMGTVYKARDQLKDLVQDSDPFVAIKILNKAFRKHPKAMISLQREVKKSQLLRHANIVAVHDFDRDGDMVFMHMELMRGTSLSGFIKKNKYKPIAREDALPIIKEMAAGLAYAHANDIVHSDFKPGNVFLVENNRVKILDFGIARARKYQDDEVSPAKTQSETPDTVFDAGELGGLTPAYASLEMFEGGDPHPADDVYALGITAYQLLSGKHPFKRKTAVEAKVQGLQPEPLKGLKRREWKAIKKALEFDRADRTPSASAFMRQFFGPRPLAKTAIAAIVILGIAATAFAYRSTIPEGPSVPFAELPLEVQQSFRENIAFGKASIDIGDVDGAWSYYSGAYQLHPRNEDAVEGLSKVADELIAMAAKMQSPQDKLIGLTMIEQISENPYMASHEKLQKARKQLAKEVGQ